MSDRPTISIRTVPSHLGRRRLVNTIMLGITGALAVAAVIPLVWIVAHVAAEGARFISPTFFTDVPKPVGVSGGGIGNAIVGSAIVVGIACVIAVPVGIAAAIYSYDNATRPLGIVIRFSTDVLSGIPSIIMGIFAYAVVVVPQGHFSALSGGFALAVIMLPIVLRTAEEMLNLVPRSLREGALALGAPRWRTSLRVLLPAAMSGVVTGIMLGISRVAGEAAPMIFTAFGNPFYAADITQPMATLPHTIFVYAISPYKDLHDKAWTTALVLIVLVLGLNLAARLFTRWRLKKMGWK